MVFLYDYINKEKVDFIIRGIRNTIDYEMKNKCKCK